MNVVMREVPLLWLGIAISVVFIVTAEAQVSVVASFNDLRCAAQMVCPNDPLLFTCTVTDSPSAVAQLTLPSGVGVQVTSANMTELVGATSLPDGVTVQSHNAIVNGGLVNYTLTLAIERASLLGGNPIICDARTVSPLTDEASCPITTDPGQPESLSQNISANTETSAVVQWGSPAMTGGNGVTISEYRVTVEGGMTQTVSHDDSGDVFTATITVPEYNTSYSVSVTAINSCGLSSQPATTTVFIEARAPPQRELSVSMSCDTLLTDGRPISINWTGGDREVRVVYPGEESVLVELTSLRGTVKQVCSDMNGCDFTISVSGDYTVSLTITNDVGSFMAVTSFSSEILFSDETLNSLPSSVNITVNCFCATDGKLFQITVRFGVTSDTGGSCTYNGDSQTANSSPNGNIFSPDFTPATGESFCYVAILTIDGINVASLNGSGDITPTKPPTPREEKESISTGVAVGISTIITLLVSLPVGVVIGSCGTLFAIRRGGGRGERKRKKKKEEFGGAIYEEPVHSVETAIPLSENQAYGQVSSQR